MFKKRYEKICNNYALKFAKKHGFQFDGWIGDRVGEWAVMGDYVIDFVNIKYDIDNKCIEPAYIKWVDYTETTENPKWNYETWYRITIIYRKGDQQ